MIIGSVYNICSMDFKDAVSELNRLLSEKQPPSFSGSWVCTNAPHVYRFLHKNVRTETGGIDWDRVTRPLDRDHQKKWRPHRKRRRKHDHKTELDLVLKRHRPKLYTFVTTLDESDEIERDIISIALVRLAQSGNGLAKEEILSHLTYTIDEWLERRPVLSRWRDYRDMVKEQIEGCIRRYRYSGSFLAYLFKTLACVGRGLRPLTSYSLDEEFPDVKKRRIENVVQDSETGQMRMYNG